MKKLFILIASILVTSLAMAQDGKSKPSPAAIATGKIGDKTITITYAQPAVKGREIWGKLVPYNQVWRTGANEATTFEVDKDVKIEGQDLKAGKYSLFTIPTEGGEWTIIFNSVIKQWGAYSYDASKDVLRVKVKSAKSENLVERLTFNVASDSVILTWEKLSVSFKVQ
ncbi:MAG: DUF2911 domain-containing protein [Saprospiraceae bacterium]|nr:DUF2911 domain-containing protein [Saprospiraceae bacterium]